MNPNSTATVSDEIASLRPVVHRLALLQLRDPASAEDVTQETMVAAMEKQATFQGRSSLRTWVIAILRFKILDVHRHRKRQWPRASEHAPADELQATGADEFFDSNRRWAAPKEPWSDPSDQVRSQQFFGILEACMTKLPSTMGRVFLMREWLELSPAEICADLELSPGNLRVLLYRARMQLRRCVEKNWGAR